MDENKNRQMETIRRNFEEGGEIVLKAEYEESQKTEPDDGGCPWHAAGLSAW